MFFIRSFTLCTAVLAAISDVAFTEEPAVEPPESYFTLQAASPWKYTIEGTVQPARTSQVSFEGKGRLRYIAPTGQAVRGQVLRADGSAAVPGDLLARQDTDIPESDVRIAEMLLKRAESVLKERQENFLRDKALTEKKAVSARQFLETSMLYETARIDRDKAKLDLLRARQVLESCSIYAPFDAIVEETYCSDGSSVDVGTPVLKIRMENPAKIVVPLDDRTIAGFDRSARILIYPAGGNAPVPARLEGPVLEGNVFECYADNPLVSAPARSRDGHLLTAIDRLGSVRVLPGRAEGAALWVSNEMLHREGEQYFVWRVRDGRNAPARLPVPAFLRLEKVTVKPLDLELVYGNLQLRGIASGSGLTGDDLLAADVPADATDGGLAVCRRRHRLFQPGQKVKVEFSGAVEPGVFTVPAGLLQLDSATGARSLLVAEKDGQRILPVTLLAREGENARIYAPELKAGQKILHP